MRRLLGCPRGLATRAGPLWAGGGASQGPEAAAGVSGAAFSALLRRCGLSGRQLRALYAPGESEARDGEFPVAVALSGGGDSMALMLLLREHLRQREVRTPLLAITVDHRLRPESALEAQQLARLCEDTWGVRHATRRCEWDAQPRPSKLEELARRQRYELLRDACREHGVRCLFVAHTLGDQLETTLFRLGRASGVNGLAGMASASPFLAHRAADAEDQAELSYESEQAAANRADVRLVRPLLSVTRAELRATCNRFGQPWIEDPTNNNLAFDRVRIRKELERLELEQGKPVLDLISRFQQTAAAAKREFARVERSILRKYVSKRRPDLVILQMNFHDDPKMFDELRNRIISDLIVEVGSKDTPPRLEAVVRLIKDLEYLEVGKTVTLGGCKVTIKDKGRQLHFRPEVPQAQRRSYEKRRMDDMVDAVGSDGDAKDEKLRVVVRVRPLHKGEEPWCVEESTPREDIPLTTLATKSSMRIQDNSVLWEKNGQSKILSVDSVLDEVTGQSDTFRTVQDCVDGLLDGFDCSVFAYGQTGTGKTYTMSGLEVGGVQEQDDLHIKEGYGVVPRSIQRLFDLVEVETDAHSNVTFSLYVSFLEIYNEKIYDLLATDVILSPTNQALIARRRKENSGLSSHRSGWNAGGAQSKDAPTLPIRQKLDGSVFVDGLTSRNIVSRSEMLQAFREGSVNREVRDNLYNQHSSRGHSIFQITLRRVEKQQQDLESEHVSGSPKPKGAKTRFSRLFFIDLAGSEKWRADGCGLTDKYATELASINKSLSALTSCVLALAHRSRAHVPFRDSVLTRLLQSSLHGSGRTSFIVTLSPSRDSLEESFSTLRFAERLRALHCRPMRRQVVTNELSGDQRVYYENQIQQMRIEVNRLRLLLKKAQRKSAEVAEQTVAAATNNALVEENRRLKELLAHSGRRSFVERDPERPRGSPEAFWPRHPPRQPEVSQDWSVRRTKQSAVPLEEKFALSPQPEQGDRFGDAMMINTADGTNFTANALDPQQELDSLVTKLQSQEARLNWMIEAEMEAHNTSSGAVLPVPAPEPSIISDSVVNEASKAPAKSWAVERMLRKQFVAVPTPLRAALPDYLSNQQQRNARLIPKRPAAAHQSATRSGALSSRVDYGVPLADLPLPGKSTFILPPNSATAAPPITMASPPRRIPRALDPPVVHLASPREAVVVPKKSGAPIPVRSQVTLRMDEPPVKSVAILKLVGSAAAAESIGKSREELVEAYKRARRAELEAMMRTMVQK